MGMKNCLGFKAHSGARQLLGAACQAEGRLRWRRLGVRRSPRQFEQVPVISITDIVYWNPAFLAAAASCWAKASVEDSPTMPQVLHIRKATSASLS